MMTQLPAGTEDWRSAHITANAYREPDPVLWWRPVAGRPYNAHRRWYRLAAYDGYARAQFNLARMYEHGEGVRQDDTEALHWYRVAADHGHARSQARLSLMYRDGRGVKRDIVAAHMWADLAASSTESDVRATAVQLRRSIVDDMTSTEIAEAKRRARGWTPEGPQ